jgi:hypothetical protein
MKKVIILLIILGLLIAGCGEPKSRTKGVYMLLDTSGTYTKELPQAQSILNYLLGVLQPGDTLAVASRPSVANNQKRAFMKDVDDFVSNVPQSPYTDISGGILQAIEYLNEADSGTKYVLIFSDLKEELAKGHIRDVPFQKYVLIFSDLKEELAKGHIRDVPFQLDGFQVIALNVTKLRQDIKDPKVYMARVEDWRLKAENGGGKWGVINDLERLDNIFTK